MATSLHHHRSGSGTKKHHHPPHVRPSKPTLQTKRASGSSKTVPKAVNLSPDFDDDDSMATSFLQYCATCEKQIIVPSNSLLYCSESCRKRDKSTSYYTADHSPPLTPFTQFSLEDLPVRDIIPPRSPTAAPRSNRSSVFYPSDTDTDSIYPSETGSTNTNGSGHARKESEAARYLRQFQSATSSERPSTTAPSSSRRPRYNRAHSSATAVLGANTSAAPSLSHTPHSVSSLASMPFTPSLNTSRPLPPRKNPYSSSAGTRSVDLVTPFAAFTTTATTAVDVAAYTTTAGDVHKETLYGLKSAPSAKTCVGLVVEGQISYEKRETLPVAFSSPGSLGRLFAEKGEKARWM